MSLCSADVYRRKPDPGAADTAANAGPYFEMLPADLLKNLSERPAPAPATARTERVVLVLEGANQELIDKIFHYLTVNDREQMPSGPGTVHTGRVKAYWFRQQNSPCRGADHFMHPTDPFLKKVNQLIECHLDDEGFRPGVLSQCLFLCEMQLHRKLKKRTGLSPSNYIRKYRLLRSRSFLRQAHWAISEVGYKVGFRSPEYFSRSFKKEFGISPSAYKKEACQSVLK